MPNNNRIPMPPITASTRIQRALILLPMLILPLVIGGARPWIWSWVAAFFFLGMGVILFVDPGFRVARDIPWTGKIFIGLILIYPFAQMAPLSAHWLELLSPKRHEWFSMAAQATGLPGLPCITYMPLTTFFSALWLVFLAGFALLIRKSVSSSRSLKWLVLPIFILAVLETFFGILQVLIPPLGAIGDAVETGLARGTFINRNHFAAFLGITWPLLFSYLLSLRNPNDSPQKMTGHEREKARVLRQKQIFGIFLIGAMLLAIFFSLSRGGMISTLIACTTLMIFRRISRRKGMLIVTAACWLVMIAYGSIIGFDTVLDRFDAIGKESSDRVRIWQDTVEMIKDHPLTGTGLGTFPASIMLYQSHLTDDLLIEHAHNDYLELTAEAGIPLAAFVILFSWGYWCVMAGRLWVQRKETEALRLNERTAERQRRTLAVGALAGSAAFLTHSLVEFNWQIPANQLYMVAMMAILGPLTSTPRGRPDPRTNVGRSEMREDAL
ncbi:MAG: O-antigen ligase family protein [Acidobacteriota bacterium]